MLPSSANKRLFAIFAILSYVLPSQPYMIQAQSQKAEPRTTGQPIKNKDNPQVLKYAPELAQLPAYSGKSKFVRGYERVSDKGYLSYQLSYCAKEDMHQVIEWYQNALKMYQWQLMNSGPQFISAHHKDGHVCFVNVNPSMQPGYPTRLQILYSQAPPKASD